VARNDSPTMLLEGTAVQKRGARALRKATSIPSLVLTTRAARRRKCSRASGTFFPDSRSGATFD
jgi:hypothetical protein